MNSLVGIWLIEFFDQQPVINVLKEIQVFLTANPSEIITIFIEDYVTSPQGLTKVFNAAGLRKFWFPVSRMPKNGGNWPLIDDMISNNQRLLVFTSKSSKEASEGIAYEWRYVVENQCKPCLLSTNKFYVKSYIRMRWDPRWAKQNSCSRTQDSWGHGFYNDNGGDDTNERTTYTKF